MVVEKLLVPIRLIFVCLLVLMTKYGTKLPNIYKKQIHLKSWHDRKNFLIDHVCRTRYKQLNHYNLVTKQL